MLKKWCELQPDRDEWTVLSAGESHSNIDLGYGMVLHSLGKLTLEEYAKVLQDSFSGASLMVSPHPSYPPLEMSAFGVKTITNIYANKDLSEFSSNIFSITQCSQENIAYKLKDICESYNGQANRMISSSYLERNAEFIDISEDICEELNYL